MAGTLQGWAPRSNETLRPDETVDRIVRVIAAALGVATAGAFVTVGPSLAAQLPWFTAWWSAGSVAISFVFPMALAVAAFVAPTWLIRTIAAVVVIGFVCVLALLAPALTTGHLRPELGAPWPLGLTALATTAAALVFPAWLCAVYSVVTASLIMIDRMLAFPGSITDVAGQDALVALLLQTVFTSLALVSLSAGRVLDRAAATARAEVTAAAGDEARRRERTRIEALVHDHVLATLLLAARSSTTSKQLSEHARAGLVRLEAYRHERKTGTVPFTELVTALRATATEIAPFAEFHSGGTGHVLADVAEAMVEAAAEALRNSIRHAGGESVARGVFVVATDRLVQVMVVDDGAGFSMTEVPSGRIGLALSIEGRMLAIGGSAQLRSRPGHGTTVMLQSERHA